MIIERQNFARDKSYELVFITSKFAFSAIQRRMREARLDLVYETAGSTGQIPFLEWQHIEIPPRFANQYEHIVTTLAFYLGCSS